MSLFSRKKANAKRSSSPTSSSTVTLTNDLAASDVEADPSLTKSETAPIPIPIPSATTLPPSASPPASIASSTPQRPSKRWGVATKSKLRLFSVRGKNSADKAGSEADSIAGLKKDDEETLREMTTGSVTDPDAKTSRYESGADITGTTLVAEPVSDDSGLPGASSKNALGGSDTQDQVIENEQSSREQKVDSKPDAKSGLHESDDGTAVQGWVSLSDVPQESRDYEVDHGESPVDPLTREIETNDAEPSQSDFRDRDEGPRPREQETHAVQEEPIYGDIDEALEDASRPPLDMLGVSMTTNEPEAETREPHINGYDECFLHPEQDTAAPWGPMEDEQILSEKERTQASEALQRENAALRKEAETSRAALQDLERQLLRRNRDVEHLSNELVLAEAERSRRRSQPQIDGTFDRTSHGAECFQAADFLTASDIVGMIDRLNAEIFQTAAHMADSFSFDDTHYGPRTVTAAEMEEQRALAAATLGEAMANALEMTRHEEDPILIQLAFQAVMAMCSQDLVKRWSVDTKTSDNFTRIYDSVLQIESQRTSGRWRALTRMHLRVSHDGPDMLANTIAFCVKRLAAVLIVGGYGESRSSLAVLLMSKFDGSLRRIGNLALQLSRTIGEQITSGDLHALYFPSGTSFDASQMEDEQGEATEEVGRVLCTTHLGLRRTEVVWGAAGTVRKIEETILVKAKVALASILEERE